VRAVHAGGDQLGGARVGALYIQGRMKLSLIRLVATLLLSGQMLPVGLPLVCDQVQRGTPADCDQEMASHTAGAAVDVTTHPTPCVNSVFCATAASAVVALGEPVPVSAGESHLVACGLPKFAPADPHPPLPPPPQA